MNTNAMGVLFAVLLGTALPAGCGDTAARDGPTLGRVVPSAEHTATGSAFPDVAFLDAEGAPHRLSSLYRDATIIALVEKPCVSADTDLVARTSEFGERVAVVEITTPPGGCDAHKQCVMTRGRLGDHLVSLCDGDGTVRRRLGAATPDAVFVLDQHGRVAASGRMADFPWLRRRAIDLALDANPATGDRWDEWLGFTAY
jgi:hypothetical protein